MKHNIYNPKPLLQHRPRPITILFPVASHNCISLCNSYTGWVFALLARCPALFFYGSGFAASLLQVLTSPLGCMFIYVGV